MHHVGIDHRRGDILVPKELLDRSDVGPRLKEVCGKRMAQRVGTDSFGDAGGDHGASDCPLNDGLVQVVAAVFAGGFIDVGSGR